jgi:2'-5' RNA ligase
MHASPEPSTRRLFVGLVPDAAVRSQVLAWRARWQWPRGVALVAPAHVHLTLAFLGDVPGPSLPALRAALGTVPVAPLGLRLEPAQVWPNGVAVLRPLAHAGLDALHAQVVAALEGVGLALAERRWRPHVTLARRAQGARPPEGGAGIDWLAMGFALVWSRLPPQVPRARYELLDWWGGERPAGAFNAPA